jgi:hypothetical protein
MLVFLRIKGQEVNAATGNENAQHSEQVRRAGSQTMADDQDIQYRKEESEGEDKQSQDDTSKGEIDGIDGDKTPTKGHDPNEAACDDEKERKQCTIDNIDNIDLYVLFFGLIQIARYYALLELFQDAISHPQKAVPTAFRMPQNRSPVSLTPAASPILDPPPPIVPAPTISIHRRVFCAPFSEELFLTKDSDLVDGPRTGHFATLVHRPLTTLMWRTVILANYFSDSEPATIEMPRLFHFLPLEQQRFEIAVQESKLLGEARPSVSQRRAVEDAVLLFLNRTRVMSDGRVFKGRMAEYVNANQIMSILLHTCLRKGRVATPYKLHRMFTDSYKCPNPALHGRERLVDHKGLEALFDSSVTYTYPNPWNGLEAMRGCWLGRTTD